MCADFRFLGHLVLGNGTFGFCVYTYLTWQEDIEDMLFYGVIYVLLLFTTISVIYNYIRKENISSSKRRK